MPMRMPMYSTISISHLAPAPLHYHNNSPPSQQRSASTHSSPAGHGETQPFVTVIQRSADDPSNSRETTQPHTLNRTPTPPLYPHALNLTARTATSTSRLEKPAGKASVQQLRIPDSIPGTGVRSPPPPSSHEKKNLL